STDIAWVRFASSTNVSPRPSPATVRASGVVRHSGGVQEVRQTLLVTAERSRYRGSTPARQHLPGKGRIGIRPWCCETSELSQFVESAFRVFRGLCQTRQPIISETSPKSRG